MIFFFFFQAEDGIRDYKVTGVQTCALPIYPELRELQYQILEIEALRSFLKFYFSFQVLSRNSRVIRRRSLWCSIQSSAASRNSLALACMDFSYSMRSSRSPAKRSARFLASRCSG